LVENPSDYEHSSARFYVTGAKRKIQITTSFELQDIDLTQAVTPQSP